MKFTATLPTKPGAYWFRHAEKDSPFLNEVRVHCDALWAVSQYGWFKLRENRGLWSGPLLAPEECVSRSWAPKSEVEARITEYLSAGGLFNPELMEHDKVRDLLIEAREALANSVPREVFKREVEAIYAEGYTDCSAALNESEHAVRTNMQLDWKRSRAFKVATEGENSSSN